MRCDSRNIQEKEDLKLFVDLPLMAEIQIMNWEPLRMQYMYPFVSLELGAPSTNIFLENEAKNEKKKLKRKLLACDKHRD